MSDNQNISPLSPEEIQEIEKRVEATTPGPWYTKKTGANFDGFSLEVTVAATAPGAFNRVYATPPGGHFPAADQEFIAKAREDIPRLIATIRDLQQQLAAYRDAGHTETVTVEGEVRCKLCGAVDMPRMAITRDTTGKPDGFKCWPKCENGPTGAPESQ